MAKKKSKKTLISRPEVIAFLRDAKENPDDDTPRLILADWLEDRGDPRGTFLRLQVEAERLPDNNPRHWELMDEADKIKQSSDWEGLLKEKGKPSYYRGLVQVLVKQRWFSGPAWSALARTELWEWVEGLTLENHTTSGLMRLVRSPLLPSISSLTIGAPAGNPVVDALVALLHAPVLSGLRSLDLGPHTSFYPAEALAGGIASSAALHKLKSLTFRSPHMSPSIAHFLATSPHLANLESLDFAYPFPRLDALGPEGVGYLTDSPFLGRLKRLILWGNQIRDDSVVILADSPFLGHIEVLDLAWNHITDAAVEHLTRSRHLSSLRKLNLSGNPLGPRSAQAIANCPGLSKLVYLGLEDTQIGNDGAQILASSPYLTSLRLK